METNVIGPDQGGGMNVQTYADAVAKFVQLAQHRTGGGRVAAQVLLSAYNGYDFQADIAGMGNLDRENFETAMLIIRGRYETGKEPHKLVTNGSEVFRALWEQWIFLHVKERAKMECPRCDGRGHIYSSDSDEDGLPCIFCGGMGRVCECRI